MGGRGRPPLTSRRPPLRNRRAQGIDGRFGLVHSNEVVEHIPRKLHAAVFDFITARTGKLLVFGMSRPRQTGHGHIANRPPQEVQLEFVRRGLRLLPNMTAALRRIGLPPWAHNRAIYTSDPAVRDEPPPELLALARPPRFTLPRMFDQVEVDHAFERQHWPRCFPSSSGSRGTRSRATGATSWKLQPYKYYVPSTITIATTLRAGDKPCSGCWARTQGGDSARIDGMTVENSPIC